ncbi:MAG: HAD family hydrolase [Muribaculaceae bacterium]|nr:HAD family hydrolase [Muribaculaceae bacterium]
MDTQKIDALIFDMDGTLWDAIPSYCRVWDETCAQLGVSRRPVEYQELLGLMGKPLGEIFEDLIGSDVIDRTTFVSALAATEDRLMPELGGRLFDGVRETLEALRSRGVRLFMVSNCSGFGLDNFLNFTGLKPLFEDWLSFGATGVDKDVNLLALRDRYRLHRPVYVGDIQRDSDSTHQAGMEFAWAAYGFGTADDAEFVLHTPADLLNLPV